jgi:hypothetical protein
MITIIKGVLQLINQKTHIVLIRWMRPGVLTIQLLKQTNEQSQSPQTGLTNLVPNTPQQTQTLQNNNG